MTIIRRRERGQSVVEFALVLPVILLVVLVGLDFGRVFLGWVTLNNAARVAANFAALNPTAAWGSPSDPTVIAYTRLVTNDAAQINCALPTPLPMPTFSDGTGVGAPAQVDLTCSFGLMTPVIGSILPNPLPVSASAVFPIRAGLATSIPVATPSPTPVPTPTPTATPSATPTPAPCTVPNLVGRMTNKAQAAWNGAGFTTNVIFNPLRPPEYQITSQEPVANTQGNCTSLTVTVYK